jgi:hypothetical protein
MRSPKRSIAVHHRLADHPLFTIDAIAEFADRLLRRRRRRRADRIVQRE